MAGRRRAIKTYSAAVDAFLKAADWLGPLHDPQVALLQNVARRLDEEDTPTASLIAQYGLASRALLQSAPVDGDGEDELDALVRTARSGTP